VDDNVFVEMKMQNRSLRLAAIILTVAFFGFSPPGQAQAKSKWVSLRPLGSPSFAELQGKDKTYRYYPVTSGQRVAVEVVGPTTLRIATRLGFSPGMVGKMSYRVQVLEGEEVIKVYSTSTEKSDLAFVGLMTLPGKKRYFQLKVPKGKHRYDFRASGSVTETIYLRFYQLAKKEKPKYVSYRPVSYKKVLNTVISQKTGRYFMATEKDPVVLQVIGPTKLKIIARGNVKSFDGGKIEFNLVAVENGREIKRVSAKKGKSKSFYPDEKKLFPTSSTSFYLEVPKGEHTYKFYMLKCEAKSVSLRFYIPEEDLQNE
jgi:hypothetical protein